MRFLCVAAFFVSISLTSAVDSEGTQFLFSFVRNVNYTNQVLSATVLNNNNQACDFTLSYHENYKKTSPLLNKTITVNSKSASDISIPQWYGWNYVTANNEQADAYLTLIGYSSCPVTLLANNYDAISQKGDTYTVLPTTWASTSFTFSLPPVVLTESFQYELVLIHPVETGVTNITIFEIGNSEYYVNFNATYSSPAAYLGTVVKDKRPRTYHIVSNKPIQIVAGVTCVGSSIDNCDHVSYMPQAPASSDCYNYDFFDDDHISVLATTPQYLTDIPGSCTIGIPITANINDGTSQTIEIIPKKESPLWRIPTLSDQAKSVAFHNGGANFHIARFYDGSQQGQSGALISTLPAITQFHQNDSSFYTRNPNDTLEVFCTLPLCVNLLYDGISFKTTDLVTTQMVDEKQYYIYSVSIPVAGFHQLTVSKVKGGAYAFFVHGKNGPNSYGYVGAVNKPSIVLAPSTVAPPTTSPSTKTSSATTNNSKNPTTSSGPTTVGSSTAKPTTRSSTIQTSPSAKTSGTSKLPTTRIPVSPTTKITSSSLTSTIVPITTVSISTKSQTTVSTVSSKLPTTPTSTTKSPTTLSTTTKPPITSLPTTKPQTTLSPPTSRPFSTRIPVTTKATTTSSSTITSTSTRTVSETTIKLTSTTSGSSKAPSTAATTTSKRSSTAASPSNAPTTTVTKPSPPTTVTTTTMKTTTQPTTAPPTTTTTTTPTKTTTPTTTTTPPMTTTTATSAPIVLILSIILPLIFI